MSRTIEEITSIINSSEWAGALPNDPNRGDWGKLASDLCLTSRELSLFKNSMFTIADYLDRPPFQNFLSLLPAEKKPVDKEIVYIIERYCGKWLRGVCTREGALQLLESAGRHIRRSTELRIRNTEGLLLAGSLEQMDSTKAILVRAFEIATLTPKIIKFGSDVHLEYEMFQALNLTHEAAKRVHLVPLRFISDIHGKQGLVMPAYVSSLSSVHCNSEADGDFTILEGAVLRGVGQMQTALSVLHAAEMYHNDVKPANILLDSNGNWHLCDWESCVSPHIARDQPVKFSYTYHPRDLMRHKEISFSSCVFDNLMLAITALLTLELLDVVKRYTLADVRQAASRVVNAELHNVLSALLPAV